MKQTISASCSMAPDSRRSLSCGRFPSIPSRVATTRFSWLRAIMGMFSSLASPLSEREMVLTSSCRLLYAIPLAFISCR